MGAYNMTEVFFEVPLNLLEKGLCGTRPHSSESFDVVNLHILWIIVGQLPGNGARGITLSSLVRGGLVTYVFALSMTSFA